jgi:hypothetical protein
MIDGLVPGSDDSTIATAKDPRAPSAISRLRKKESSSVRPSKMEAKSIIKDGAGGVELTKRES